MGKARHLQEDQDLQKAQLRKAHAIEGCDYLSLLSTIMGPIRTPSPASAGSECLCLHGASAKRVGVEMAETQPEQPKTPQKTLALHSARW